MGKFLCFVVFIIGVIVMASSFPPAYAEVVNSKGVDHTDIGSQANQIKFLIGIMVCLLGGNMWWFRLFIIRSESKDKEQDERIQKTSKTLNTLKVQHDMCMKNGPCSKRTPDNLKEVISEALQPLFNRLHEQQKEMQ